MLVTHWNEASRALPVLTLKSNYLDCWLNSLPTVTRYCNYYVDDRNNRERIGQDDVLCSPFYISSYRPAADFQ